MDLSVIVGRDVEPHVGMRVRLTPQALSRRRIAAKVYVLMILVFFLSGCSRASSLALCEYATACAQALCAYRCEAHAFAQQLCLCLSPSLYIADPVSPSRCTQPLPLWSTQPAAPLIAGVCYIGQAPNGPTALAWSARQQEQKAENSVAAEEKGIGEIVRVNGNWTVDVRWLSDSSVGTGYPVGGQVLPLSCVGHGAHACDRFLAPPHHMRSFGSGLGKCVCVYNGRVVPVLVLCVYGRNKPRINDSVICWHCRAEEMNERFTCNWPSVCGETREGRARGEQGG